MSLILFGGGSYYPLTSLICLSLRRWLNIWSTHDISNDYPSLLSERAGSFLFASLIAAQVYVLTDMISATITSPTSSLSSSSDISSITEIMVCPFEKQARFRFSFSLMNFSNLIACEGSLDRMEKSGRIKLSLMCGVMSPISILT